MSADSASLAALTDQYYRAWFRFHPELAVDVGVWGYEHLLTPFTPDEIGPLVCLNDQLVISLDEIDRASLSADDCIDFDLLRGAALLENEYWLDLAQRAPDPARLLPIQAIYQLTIRAVPDPAAALGARLAAVPASMGRAIEYLRPWQARVPRLWADSALTAAREGAGYLRALARSLPENRRPAELLPLTLAAAEAVERFAAFLETDLCPQARGSFAAGEARFARLLRDRHFVDLEPADLHRFGERLCASVQAELGEACRALVGTTDLSVALARVRQHRPAPGALLGVYRREMRAARDFVVQRGFVTLPAREALEIVETPVFLRNQIPFAAYVEPSPLDPEQLGYYYVTPPADAAQTAEHDEAGIRHTCVHEAWPGHHLQFVRANTGTRSRGIPRLLNTSATLYEGWALYCEQLMAEQGFLSGPAHRVMLLRDRLWRALRVVIDVDLHTRGCTAADAAERLQKHLGFTAAQAISEVTWYSRSPTVPLGYALGWATINALRDATQATESAAALREFHDKLLAAGSIGLPRAIAYAFGAARWPAARAQLLS